MYGINNSIKSNGLILSYLVSHSEMSYDGRYRLSLKLSIIQ